jgi:hypothetical protein
MQKRFQAVVCSVPSALESGVRAVDRPHEGLDDEESFEDFASEELDDTEPVEGSFFGTSDEAACNRVYGMFARSSVRHGHGDDLLSRDQRNAVRARALGAS